MAPRLTDIAAQAGVSEATVSRVLNGRSGVAESTRQSVFAALDVLGYERPPMPRRRSAGLIGLITPELNNPIFPAFAQVVERALTRYGYTPVLCTQTPGGSTEDELVDSLIERKVTGIVFVSGLHADSSADAGRYTRLIGLGVPFVMINGYRPDINAPFISADDRAAMRLAVEHLVRQGHRRIGLAVGPRRFVPVLRKIEGFGTAVRELLGTADDERVQHSLFSVAGGQAAAGELLDRDCTALICASDLMALGAIRAIRDRRLRVPDDVSVIGFDDSPLIAFTDPPLTTIRQPVESMGLAAVDALLEEIGGTPTSHSDFLFATELVVRGSTSSAAASITE